MVATPNSAEEYPWYCVPQSKSEGGSNRGRQGHIDWLSGSDYNCSLGYEIAIYKTGGVC